MLKDDPAHELLARLAAGEGEPSPPGDFEDLIWRLRRWGQAYPESAFPEPTEEERRRLQLLQPGLQDRVAAAMGRHMGREVLLPAADALERLMTLVAGLRLLIGENARLRASLGALKAEQARSLETAPRRRTAASAPGRGLAERLRDLWVWGRGL